MVVHEVKETAKIFGLGALVGVLIWPWYEFKKDHAWGWALLGVLVDLIGVLIVGLIIAFKVRQSAKEK